MAKQKAVSLWLYSVAFLVFVMVLVGGATRLTDSGLSIVEWKPVTGAVPPLSEGAWLGEFEKYKKIPEYERINHGMSLDDFKFIYWWEWAHRFLGRLIGLAFFVPFIFFLLRGEIEPRFKFWLWGLLGLGALQGGIGWWMVSSGLVGRVDVAPYRLAVHLILASLIFAGVLLVARLITMSSQGRFRVSLWAIGIIGFIFLQIFLGGLVAGNDAGLTYNSWPKIDGAFVPDFERLFLLSPWWINLFENHLTVQFLHRSGAYVLLFLSVWAVFATGRGKIVFALLMVQACVGIAALLLAVPLWLALLHQGLAILILGVAVFTLPELVPDRR